ncbi:hypothetical protein EJ07DRAFT_159104 [Lizonia empirigonia]|nr:hypothetical protein EJ07DRAFT_159104 [Lizonia empirigonia]
MTIRGQYNGVGGAGNESGFLFGVIFGAVYGVKKAHSEESEREEHERLFAAQGGSSTLETSQARTHFTAPRRSSPRSQRGYRSSRTPSLGPTPGRAAVEAGLRRHGKPTPTASSLFHLLPYALVTARKPPSRSMHFHDGTWGEWQELDFAAGFLRRPAVVSRAQGKIDIMNVDSDGYVWVVSYDGENWSERTELGSEFTSDMAATSLGEDRIDVFGKRGNTVLHKQWTSDSGWAQDWEDLGDPFANKWSFNGSPASPPLVVSWRDAAGNNIIDVVINSGGSSHKLFSNGAWSEWTGMSASHEGYEFPDTQSIVRCTGDDSRPLAHLVSRGTDNCIHYTAFNGTGGGFWTFLWCNGDADGWSVEDPYPTQFLPTFVADAGAGELELLARCLAGSVLRLQIHGAPAEIWSSDNWEDLGKPGG